MMTPRWESLIYAHTHTHKHTHTHTNTYTHTYIQQLEHTFTYMHIYIHTHTHKYSRWSTLSASLIHVMNHNSVSLIYVMNHSYIQQYADTSEGVTRTWDMTTGQYAMSAPRIFRSHAIWWWLRECVCVREWVCVWVCAYISINTCVYFHKCM